MLSPAVRGSARPRDGTDLHAAVGASRRRVHRATVLPLVYFAIGFTPITSLALALIGVVSLPVSTALIVLPSVFLAVALGVRYPRYGRLALQGWLVGIAAVLVYDATRVPWLLAGTWPDFIPNIGALLLGRTEEHALLGYAWRWLGNGGGMGMAFFMAYPLVASRLRLWPAALLFGVAVWGCLLATLLLAPAAQILLFRLTPFTFAVSLAGHIVFGGMLALVMDATRLNLRPYEPDRSGEAAPLPGTEPAVV